MKVKVRQREEWVIGGWLLGERRRRDRIGALLLGCYAPNGSALRYVGRVGFGFRERDHRELPERLGSLERFEARDLIAALLRPWFAARDLVAVRELFAGTGVSWGPYQTFRQLVQEDARCSVANPLFEEVDHPDLGRYLTPGSPPWFNALERQPVGRTPLLGEHTEEILAELLRLDSTEIGRLVDQGVVARPVTSD